MRWIPISALRPGTTFETQPGGSIIGGTFVEMSGPDAKVLARDANGKQISVCWSSATMVAPTGSVPLPPATSVARAEERPHHVDAKLKNPQPQETTMSKSKKTTKPNAKGKSRAEKKASPKAPATTKATREPKPAKEKKVSALDAAHQILSKATEPMNAKSLIEAIEKAGLWKSPEGKTPHATLSSAIQREITNKGKESRFKKASPGHFAAA